MHARTAHHLKAPLRVLLHLWTRWVDDNIQVHAAAVAFFTTFSIPPLLLLMLSIAGLFLDPDMVRAFLFGEIRHAMGDQIALFLQETAQSIWQDQQNTVFLVAGTLSLLFGAMGFFITLRSALDQILGIPKQAKNGMLHFLRAYVIAFLLVLVSAIVLPSVVVASALLSQFGKHIGSMIGVSAFALQMSDVLLTLVIIFVLSSALYMFLPSGKMRLFPSMLGALVTTVLFSIGKIALSQYLTFAHLDTRYGASASLVLLLLWIYFSAQAFLIGAECMELLLMRKERAPKATKGPK